MTHVTLEGLINPAVLKWAREASRMDHETVAKLAGVKDPERVTAWESRLE